MNSAKHAGFKKEKKKKSPKRKCPERGRESKLTLSITWRQSFWVSEIRWLGKRKRRRKKRGTETET